MTDAIPYCLIVYNIPRGTTWQQIKDVVKLGEKKRINVTRADVMEGTRIAMLWFHEYADLQLAYEFLNGKKKWKNSILKVEKWIRGQAPFPNTDSSQIQPPNKSAYYRAPIPRSYSSTTSNSTAPISESGPSGSASNFGVASTSDSTTYNSPPLARVYLTDRRGVHIGNATLDTSESAIRHLVARAVHVLEEQILDTLYPPHYSLAIQNVDHSHHQHQSQHAETIIPQYSSWKSPYPATAMIYEYPDVGNDAEQLSEARLEPEFIKPLVVDGSKNRDLPKSSSNGERSTKGKSQKDHGSGSKGKQKHKEG